jgi:hypothetical protein
MMNDFLPGIVSVAVLTGVFIFACMSDVRRLRRLEAKRPPAGAAPLEKGKNRKNI